MKYFGTCFFAFMASSLILMSNLAYMVSAAPHNALSTRNQQYGTTTGTLAPVSGTNIDFSTKLSVSVCNEIASSLKPVSIGSFTLTVYDHVCFETCVYLHQIYYVEHLEVHLHVSGTFHGTHFDLDVKELVDIQVIIDNGCAVITEHKKLIIDLQMLNYEELIKICEKLQITIDRQQITTKQEILAYIGFEIKN